MASGLCIQLYTISCFWIVSVDYDCLLQFSLLPTSNTAFSFECSVNRVLLNIKSAFFSLSPRNFNALYAKMTVDSNGLCSMTMTRLWCQQKCKKQSTFQLNVERMVVCLFVNSLVISKWWETKLLATRNVFCVLFLCTSIVIISNRSKFKLLLHFLIVKMKENCCTQMFMSVEYPFNP